MALPTPTAVAPVAGYIPTGVRRYIWVATIANIASPSSAEITAGTDLTGRIGAVSGWTGSSQTVELPNALNRFTPKVSGLISADDSSITLNLAKSGTDSLSLFNDGADGTTPTSGNMVICYEGIVTGGRMRVFPASVTSVQPSSDIGAASTAEVMFAITQPPSAMLTVPTA